VIPHQGRLHHNAESVLRQQLCSERHCHLIMRRRCCGSAPCSENGVRVQRSLERWDDWKRFSTT
jgi:hypothetical protein